MLWKVYKVYTYYLRAIVLVKNIYRNCISVSNIMREPQIKQNNLNIILNSVISSNTSFN